MRTIVRQTFRVTLWVPSTMLSRGLGTERLHEITTTGWLLQSCHTFTIRSKDAKFYFQTKIYIMHRSMLCVTLKNAARCRIWPQLHQASRIALMGHDDVEGIWIGIFIRSSPVPSLSFFMVILAKIKKTAATTTPHHSEEGKENHYPEESAVKDSEDLMTPRCCCCWRHVVSIRHYLLPQLPKVTTAGKEEKTSGKLFFQSLFYSLSLVFALQLMLPAVFYLSSRNAFYKSHWKIVWWLHKRRSRHLATATRHKLVDVSGALTAAAAAH